MIEPFYVKLGLTLRALREDRELSQDEVARFLGFAGRQSYYNIEEGRSRLKLIHAVQLCELFEIAMEDLTA